MTTKKSHLMGLLCAVTFAPWASPAAAYPPDNAAVLYYQAFMLYQAEDEIKPMLDDYWHGRIERNETLEAYLAKNRPVIDMVLDATRIDRCDWGLDYAQGTEVLLPPHNQARNVFFLIAAEATMQFDKGHPRTAMEHCIAMYRMARHLNERPLICYLVGVAINAATHKCVTRFLSRMPPDAEMLTWLQSELAELDKQPFSIGPVLKWKREAAIVSMAPDKIGNAVQAGLDDCDFKTKVLELVRTADAQFYTRNIAYWNDFMDHVEAAFAIPYPQAYAKLGELSKTLSADCDTNQDAVLTACFAPTFQRVYALSIRLAADSNALRNAIDVYSSYAKTGRLPDALPAGLPQDPFSGEPFQYEKTASGFTLRCAGKDLDKNEPYTFEYGVKK
ncbi:MAG: hypothetical protein GXY19_04815 [Phycisphaerae bacterium]|nr:hypothetical protein [Phycisphaerae bacterium]